MGAKLIGAWAAVALVLGLAVPPAEAASIGAPGAFRVHASNGFEITVLSSPAHGGLPAGVLVTASRPEQSVLYSVPATVGEESIAADLGSIGRIDVHYVRNGGRSGVSSSCAKGEIEFDSGFYEGTIELHGEEGYTELDATRAIGDAAPLLSLLCSEAINEGIGGHSPGARLTARRAVPGGRAELEARINSPIRLSRFHATIFENRGRLQVERSVEAVGPSSDFRYDVREARATLAPPTPFAGVARFQRRESGLGRLLGTLSVEFPGRPHVRLAGPRVRAGLQRYVDNPSHPFRPAASVLAWPSTKP